MNRIPQNDPGFLAFQRKLRSENRKRRWKRTAVISAVVVLILGLLAGGVIWIYRSADIPNAEPNDAPLHETPNDTPSLETGDGGDENNQPPSTSTPSNDDPVDPPNDRDDGKTVVYIDAGHGFANSYGVADKGAGDGTPYHELTGKHESDLNLDVAFKLKELLLEKGYEVIMMREGESAEHVTVNDRVNRVNNSIADIFVSIHANSSDTPTASGARLYYSTLNVAAMKCQKYASVMADALNATEGASLKKVNVFTDRPDVAVIKGIRIPTVLVETCFMTSAEDAALAATEEWTVAMATGICLGIEY